MKKPTSAGGAQSTAITSSTPNPLNFTFQGGLLRRQPSQLDLAYSQVQATLLALEDRARAIGGQLGVRFGPVELSEPNETGNPSKELALLLRLMTGRIHMFMLDRVNGTWGLWYSPMVRAVAQPVVPLRDAPVEARTFFLEHSEEFFGRYLATAEVQLKAPQTAVAAGQRTLDLLANVQES